jgi:lambda repressor-like predicted transcriptional regulator
MHALTQAAEPRAKHRQGVTPMHPEDIKAALKKVKSNQSKIAETCKVHKSTVAHVIMGRSSSRKIARAIARTLGLTLDDIWPGRYAAKPGDPKRDPAKLSRWQK